MSSAPVARRRRAPRGHAVAATASGRSAPTPVDLLEAKLVFPVSGPVDVSRPGLVNRLRAATGNAVITLVAPAGYGKTTLLGQWAEREARPVAWVTLDQGDNDATRLLRYVAAALGRLELVDREVVAALAASRPSLRPLALPRLTAAVFRCSRPFVLVLDDVHEVGEGDAAEAIVQLARHVPAGSTLVLAGRTPPRIPAARLRAEGRLLELGANHLVFGRREASLLMRKAGVSVDEPALTELVERTEGWPAALRLAGLSIADGADPSAFAGVDRLMTDYVRRELLAPLAPADRRFLTRSSVLESLSGPLCDAALQTEGSATRLESLETQGLLIVPLDRKRERYRLHGILRAVVRAELERIEPRAVSGLNGRAAVWCEANDETEAALGHATASRDAEAVARLVGVLALPAYHGGRISTVESWLERVRAGGAIDRWPDVAIVGAWTHAVRGRPEEAAGWLEAAERSGAEGRLPDGTASLEPRVALIRAAIAAQGPDRMLADAETAERGLPPTSQWRPAAQLLGGVARMLVGDSTGADAAFADAAGGAARLAATDTQIVALSERSLLSAAQGDHERARTLADEARAVAGEAGLDDYGTGAIQLAASARSALRHGDGERARSDLNRADMLRPRLTFALPWLSVHTLLELARARMGLLELSEARSLLSDAETILRQRPDLGSLAAQATTLHAELEGLVRRPDRRGSLLTPAELRLVPLLATHLSFREIGERLHVSRNTVKTQAIAVYRKLGVSCRSEAIESAAALGLVTTTFTEEAPSPRRDDAAPVARM